MNTIFKNKDAADMRHQFGVNRIALALNRMSRVFGDFYLVPSNNSYLSSYESKCLQPPASRRDLHKVKLLNKNKRQYLCYALRASVEALQQKLTCDLCLRMVTIYFSKQFKVALAMKKNPISYYGQLLKYRFGKVGIKDYFAVFEIPFKNKFGSLNMHGLHVHIVFRCRDDQINVVKRALKVERELLKDSSGGTANSAFRVTSNYRRVLNGSEGRLVEESDFEYRLWRGQKRLVSKRLYPIDIGVADYLSKGLSTKIFGNSRNYYLSRDLNTKCLNLLSRVLEI